MPPEAKSRRKKRRRFVSLSACRHGAAQNRLAVRVEGKQARKPGGGADLQRLRKISAPIRMKSARRRYFPQHNLVVRLTTDPPLNATSSLHRSAFTGKMEPFDSEVSLIFPPSYVLVSFGSVRRRQV